MKVPRGTHVGLCAHIHDDYSAEGMVFELVDDLGRTHVVVVCRYCFLRYSDGEELIPLVARELVVGRGGVVDITMDVEVPS